MRIHCIQTGTVAIKRAQRHGEGHGPGRRPKIYTDRRWTEPLPIYAWVIEHPEGMLVVDTGETARTLHLANSAAAAAETVLAAAHFVLIGAEPHTEWPAESIARDERGFILTGRDLLLDGHLPEGCPVARPPDLPETSVPGVFAVGDVRHHSMKRVASAVGEGSTAISLVHEYLQEGLERAAESVASSGVNTR